MPSRGPAPVRWNGGTNYRGPVATGGYHPGPGAVRGGYHPMPGRSMPGHAVPGRGGGHVTEGRVTVRDHRGDGRGYYGHGAYGGHTFYYGTHGWNGYSRGYRYGYHQCWHNGMWMWDWGYWYDPYYVGPLYYFDDGYVPAEIAPQPEYQPVDGQYYDDGQAQYGDDGQQYGDDGQQYGEEQPQDDQAEQPQPQQPYGDDDTYYQGPSAPGNTPTR